MNNIIKRKCQEIGIFDHFCCEECHWQSTLDSYLENGRWPKPLFGVGLVGDRYPPGPLKSKGPHERPKGPINRKVILSWVWGETTSKAERHKAGLVQTRTAHSVKRMTATEIRLSRVGASMQRSHARISRRGLRRDNLKRFIIF
jgi:hypothetical protein